MSVWVPPKPYLLLAMIATLCANEALARKWTDSAGKFSVEADFVGVVGGEVLLKRSDGGLIRLAMDKLSEPDQQHVQALTAPVAAPQAPRSGRAQSMAAPPKTTPPRTGTPPSGDNATQIVIAEGTGTNADDALKDAFREAVCQVVGSVVDAETLVKNDQLIEDTILTYSNGFVKAYDRISEKMQGGLIRVKIRATVERRNLIAKLKAKNVTVKNIDGQSLFAEATTKLDEEKGAEALLRKALEGFPGNCLKTEVVGKPELVTKDGALATKDGDNVSIRVRIDFKADAQASKAFGVTLQQVLGKIGKDKGSFFLTAKQVVPGDKGDPTISFRPEAFPGQLDKLMPKVFDYRAKMRQDEQFVVAINVKMSKLGDRTEWSYYCLDAVLKRLFVEAAMRQAQCRISMLNSDGDEVLADLFRPDEKGKFEITLLGAPLPGFSGRRVQFIHPNSNCVLISPLFFRSDPYVCYAPVVTLKQDLQLTLDELKSVSSVKCELQFSDPAPE